MRTLKPLIVILLICACTSAKKLPQEQYYAFKYYFVQEQRNDSVLFYLKNPIKCPINIQLAKDNLNSDLHSYFGQINLKAMQDTIIRINYPKFNLSSKSKYIVRYGNFNQKIKKNVIAFPFPQGKTYKVMQGYNGKFSHNTLYSKYAIDFNLQVGDTIASADKGYVVGVIEDYKEYGTSKAWRDNDKSNYITLYHPHSGLFTQYVHLNYKGALVELGDFIEPGQPIGISGMTGFTTKPHLHFNVKYPTSEHGLISTEITFENDVSGNDLKKGDFVKNL